MDTKKIKKFISDIKVQIGFFVLVALILIFIIFKFALSGHGSSKNEPSYQMVFMQQGFPMIVNTNDNFTGAFLYKNKGYSPHLDSYYMQFLPRGSTVIDIGAGYGYHSIHFARKADKFSTIYAIEPRADVMRIADYNFKLNDLDNVKALNHMVYSVDDVKHIRASKSSSSWQLVPQSRLSKEKDKSSLYLLKVHKLDTVLNNVFGVNLMRINGYGAEIEIIKGAKSIIEKSPNIAIFMHWDRDLIANYSNASEVIQQLSDIGFGLWQVNENSMLRLLSVNDLMTLKEGDIIITKKELKQ